MGISSSDQHGRAVCNDMEKLFVRAAQADNSFVLENLLRSASASQRRALLRATDCSGQNSLTSAHWCAKLGNVCGLSVLLEAGATTEQKTSDGRTPLMLAVLAGNLDCAHLLLSRGCNVNVTTTWGDSALHFAAQCPASSGVDCLQLLLRFGANAKVKCSNGWTALHWAARECHPLSVKVLIAAGCPVDAKDNLRVTALSEAAREGCFEAVDMLLGASACVNQRDISDNLALHEAVVNGHVCCAAALLRAGTVPNERGGYKWDTALHMAVRENQPACVQLLLEAGANPFLKNLSKRTCLDIAQSSQCNIRYLLRDYILYLDHEQWHKFEERERFFTENKTGVWLLSKLCRFTVRRVLGACHVNQISQLPVSTPVKKFLLYENTSADECDEKTDILAASGLALQSSKLLFLNGL